jgi:hypothetical protein
MNYQSGCKCISRTCKNKLNNKETKSQEDQCDWWINSEKYKYCFWIYVKAQSGPDGSMKELVQSQIAELMGWSNTKTHFALKEAMVELIAALKMHKANELLDEDPEADVTIPEINDLTIVSEDYE